jgi:hypothetical protein
MGVMVELLGADTKLMAHLTILIGSKWRLLRDAQRRIPGWTGDHGNFGRLERDVDRLASLRRRADALEASISSSATGRGRRARAARRN